MSAPPVLFIHGFPFDHTMWRHQLDSPVLSRWNRIAPHLRGFGAPFTLHPPDDWSMARYADDLVQVLDSLDIREPVVCGLSMGGYIAFELLRQVPTRIRALILCNTKAVADTPEGKRGRDALAARAQKEGARGVAHELVPKLLARATHTRQPKVMREVTEMIERQPVSAIVGALRALRDRPDSTPLLARIRVPVLVVAGDDDQVVPAAVMQEMAAAIAGSQFVVIPGAGHLPPLEQPAALNQILADFLSALG